MGSEQLLGGAPFAFAGDPRPKVLFLVGEREYQTRESLTAFAAKELTSDYRVQFLFAADGSNDFGKVAGALSDADALFISVRRRALLKPHLDAVRAFVAAGKPVLGIRTASHAFSLRGKPAPAGHAVWDDFDASVFGGNYTGHHGNKLATKAKVIAAEHPITAGLSREEFPTGGSLYEVLPLRGGCTVLLEGTAETIDQKQPVAWTFVRGDGGRSFYTSLGHVADFKRAEFIALLKNALRWSLSGKEVSAVPDRGGGDEDDPLSPEESLGKMRVPDDLAVDLVLSEPLIAQPLHLSFDARGRLWVVQYRQYPDPAGLKELSRDKVWRVAYDRMPPPPPHAEGSPFRGKDRISIHEDTNGDGRYDTHKVFADGLNMATSVAHGDGGIWVTNPPYLLFFPDADGDDSPDGRPVVHLKGFGLEDSHSIANSLTLGPDGWLYGAQGSTVSAAIVRPGIDAEVDAVRSMGQNIWRYHPQRKVYEIFAEGGGNAFGVEIDSKGRVFSGHNGGDTRGFHYVQGAYYQKTWGKHGALTNPHTYGFFPAMKHAKVARFVHQFVIYEDDQLPPRYRQKLWGVDILHRNIVLSEVIADGSTFRTEDVERVVKSDDPWFRPVMIADAPDGSLLIADWCDEQVNHYRNHEGEIDHQRGRIYRVSAKGMPRRKVLDLATADVPTLKTSLKSVSRRVRRTALSQLAERGLSSSAPDLEELWLDTQRGVAAVGLDSRDPHVRREAVRLSEDATPLAALALVEEHPEVLAQLAASAKQAPPKHGLAIAETLARRDELAADPHIPLLVWWAFEAFAKSDTEALFEVFRDSSFWRHRIVRKTLLSRVMRRFAAVDDFARCAELLRIAPDDESKALLIRGFVEAVKGQLLGELPAELLSEFAAAESVLPLALRLRIDGGKTLPDALATVADPTVRENVRVELIAALGEIGADSSREALAKLLSDGAPEAVELAAVASLGSLGGGADALFAKLSSPRATVRGAAASVLAGGQETAFRLLEHDGAVDVGDVALIETLRAHDDPAIAAALAELGSGDQSSKPHETEIARVRAVIANGGGVPKKGETHFVARCSGCHQMYGKGGIIGPDLTSYQRGDREALLLSIIAPSVEIREGFESVVVKTKTGDVHAGFRVAEDERVLTFRNMAGASRSLSKADIDTVTETAASVMPPGLLAGLDDAALRDLFAYLRATTPPY